MSGLAMGSLTRLAVLALWCAALPLAAHDDGDCSGFTWDVSRELAALRASPRLLTASAAVVAPPAFLEEGQHFAATLIPQTSITFATPPGRAARAPAPTGGLLAFKSGRGGIYRISLTTRHWIDVVDGDNVITSRAHQGRSSCEALHKVVEFELPAQRELTIQLSGDDAATVGIVITAVD